MHATNRYQALADALSARIRKGILQPGDRLPSVRQLCELHTASPATVTHALHLLEDAGLIEARPRLGFFVRSALRQFAQPEQCAEPGLPQPIALAGHRKLVIEFAHECGQTPLGMSALDDGLAPTQALRKLLVQALQRDEQILLRASYEGDAPLREQIARRSLLLGCDFHPDEIVLTHGDTEALDLCLRVLTRPGDVVAIATPGPLRTLEMLEGHGLQVLEIPAHPCNGLSLDALDFALRHNRVAACIVNVNFPSPTGSLLSDADKARLAELAQRLGVPLIEVDTFGELAHNGQRPKPVKAWDRHDNILYCSDFSAVISPGFNVGYIAAGRQRLTLAASRTVHGEPIPALIQHALSGMLASGQFERSLRRLRSQLAANMQAYRRAVYAHFPPGTRVACGEGGFLLWLELPRELDATELQRRARCQGQSFAPGALFSLGSSFNNCLRLNAGFALTAQIEEGLRLIGRLAYSLLDELAETA